MTVNLKQITADILQTTKFSAKVNHYSLAGRG